MADLALQRKNMVESQVRPSDVTDRRITAAMLTIPREKFVPENLTALAYMDEALPLGGGRAMLAPRVLARLIQLARIEAPDRVLLIGDETGYPAALIAGMCNSVTVLTADAQSGEQCLARMKDLGIANVSSVAGPIRDGWPAGSPYNAVLLLGNVDDVPAALIAQLVPDGRLVAIENEAGVGRAVVRLKVHEGATRRVAFEAAGPVLPDFKRAAAFSF